MRDTPGTGPHYGEIVALGVDICIDVPCVEVHVKADGYCMGADVIEELRSARRGHEHQSD